MNTNIFRVFSPSGLLPSGGRSSDFQRHGENRVWDHKSLSPLLFVLLLSFPSREFLPVWRLILSYEHRAYTVSRFDMNMQHISQYELKTARKHINSIFGVYDKYLVSHYEVHFMDMIFSLTFKHAPWCTYGYYQPHFKAKKRKSRR